MSKMFLTNSEYLYSSFKRDISKSPYKLLFEYAHNNISKIIKNGNVLFEGNQDSSKYLGVFIDRSNCTCYRICRV